MTDNLELQIRFHGEDAPLGLYGEEAEQLAFPDGKFASEIEYGDRRWRFSQHRVVARSE